MNTIKIALFTKGDKIIPDFFKDKINHKDIYSLECRIELANLISNIPNTHDCLLKKELDSFEKNDFKYIKSNDLFYWKITENYHIRVYNIAIVCVSIDKPWRIIMGNDEYIERLPKPIEPKCINEEYNMWEW